jgi:hypothetical protein
MRHSGAVSEKKRLALLAGGWNSTTRQESLEQATQLAVPARKKGFEVTLIDPVFDLVRLTAQLVSARADLVVNLLDIPETEHLHVEYLLKMGGLRFVRATKALDFIDKVEAIINT